MRKQLTLLLCVLSIIASAQKKGKPETYAKTITAADLKKQLYIVASREMEGRETATEGQRKAAAYIEGEFKRIGLQPGANGSYQQAFPIYQDSLMAARLEVDGKTFALDTDFNVSLSSLNATMRFSEAVFIPADASADSVQAADLAGKLVLLQPGAGTSYQLLQNRGVAAVLLISPAYPRTTRAILKNQMLHGFKKSITPQQGTVSPAVAQAILKSHPDSMNAHSQITTYKTDVLLDVQKETRTLQSTNVVGVLPGTDLKDEYLFITAHYDHIGKRDTVINYGADDDGSGTVSVIELAEAFTAAKKRGNGPRRTLVFMTVSGEEKGLWGSEYYGDHPLFPLERTTADLNIDMIGRIDPKRKQGDSTNYVYVVGDDKLSSDLRPISEAANKKYTRLELDYKYNDPDDKEFIYYRSDHYNFAKNGIPIIFYFNGTHNDYHRPTDTPDKINYPLLAKRAQLVFYTAWEMANRQQMLKRDLPRPQLRR
jgi:Zn-dependent M28 family amino/carboxypeptidase